MAPLTPAQRRFLRSRANRIKPVILVGKAGVTPALLEQTRQALEAHELIKVRFLEFKSEKDSLTETIASETDSEIVGILGYVATIYRGHPQSEKRKYVLP